MKAICIIPARHDSGRFPGKPLAEIAGRTLINRVWSIAKAVDQFEEVYIATDDDRISAHAKTMGALVIMTGLHCRNGSERVYEAVEKLSNKADIIVNFQGDAVLTPPWILADLVDAMKLDPDVQYATPAAPMSLKAYDAKLKEFKKEEQTRAGGTYVVFDSEQNALYFSKMLLPFIRHREVSAIPVYKHIGQYAYRRKALKDYVNLKPGKLEEVEGLEQLRILENGRKLKVVLTDYKGRTPCSIDNIEDIALAEEIIAREGELV